MGLFHHVLVFMGDLQLVHPALNLSTLDAGILIMEGTDLRCSYSYCAFCGTPPSCLKVRVGGGGLEQFSVSPRPLGFGFGIKGLRFLGQGLRISNTGGK